MSNLTLAIQNQKLRFWNGNLINLKGRNRYLPVLFSKTKRASSELLPLQYVTFFTAGIYTLKLPSISRQRIIKRII